MNFAKNYIAVGVSQADDADSCVVVALTNGDILYMTEGVARKLADDLLRNANYLWGVEEEKE